MERIRQNFENEKSKIERINKRLKKMTNFEQAEKIVQEIKCDFDDSSVEFFKVSEERKHLVICVNVNALDHLHISINETKALARDHFKWNDEDSGTPCNIIPLRSSTKTPPKPHHQ